MGCIKKYSLAGLLFGLSCLGCLSNQSPEEAAAIATCQCMQPMTQEYASFVQLPAGSDEVESAVQKMEDAVREGGKCQEEWFKKKPDMRDRKIEIRAYMHQHCPQTLVAIEALESKMK